MLSIFQDENHNHELSIGNNDNNNLQQDESLYKEDKMMIKFYNK